MVCGSKRFSNQKKIGTWEILKLILALSLLGQWALNFYTVSVYAQYFLYVTWLEAIFLALAVKEGYELVKKQRGVKWGYVLGGSLLLIIFTVQISKINLNKKNLNWQEQAKGLIEIWEKVPSDTAVYKSILFRPMLYPLPPGYYIENFPKERVAKMPSLSWILEQKKPQKLYLDNSFFATMENFKPDWVYYIKTNYQPAEGEKDWWERKKEKPTTAS